MSKEMYEEAIKGRLNSILKKSHSVVIVGKDVITISIDPRTKMEETLTDLMNLLNNLYTNKKHNERCINDSE